MTDIFFQIFLFLVGAIIGVVAQFIPKPSQKRMAVILALLLIAISSAWGGYEVGARQADTRIRQELQPTISALEEHIAKLATTPSTSAPLPTTVSQPTPTNTEEPILSIPTEDIVMVTPSCDDLTDIELLASPWRLEGKGGSDAQPETHQAMQSNVLQGKDVLRIKIDLNGASFSEGSRKDEAAIIIDQPDQNGQWTVASVATHNIENGKDGKQIIYIPLADFEGLTSEGVTDGGHLDVTKSYGPLHVRFWNEEDFVVEIFSIVACNSISGQ
jgi:hypothetical protein